MHACPGGGGVPQASWVSVCPPLLGCVGWPVVHAVMCAEVCVCMYAACVWVGGCALYYL